VPRIDDLNNSLVLLLTGQYSLAVLKI